MELVVALAISSLVIGMVYIIYDHINRQMVQYSMQQNELMEYNQFQSFFTSDIYLCDEIKMKKDDELVLIFNDKEFIYGFKPDYITRNRLFTVDTFKVKTNGLEFNKADEIDGDYNTINLTIDLLKQSVVLFESKRINLADKINSHFLDEH